MLLGAMPGNVGPVRSRRVPATSHSGTSDSVTASTDSKIAASTTWPRPCALPGMQCGERADRRH